MPRLTAPSVLQIALLLSAVPAQYFISRWCGSTAAQRYHAATRLLRIWKDWRTSYLDGTAWMDWTSQQISKVQSLVGLGQEVGQESPPVEIMLYDNDMGYFGASKAVRSPRPPYVFLRVGEVVLERKRRMVGVVVSWDPELRAPAEWVDKMHASSEGIVAERTPHYKVLFGGPGPSSLLVAYLPQTQLERVTEMKAQKLRQHLYNRCRSGHHEANTMTEIPTLENYFTHFDGKRFIMKPWLRELYPDDESDDA